MFVVGISFIPSQGSHTQKIPPITSVKDSKVNSAAGIFFDAIAYSIMPKQTKLPWTANKDSFFPDDKKFNPLKYKTAKETKKQTKPARQFELWLYSFLFLVFSFLF